MLTPVPQPGESPATHEDLFIVRYQRLLGWALRLTEGKRASAEDLVHDVFIQFTLKQPNLATIESLDDYLFVMLRNLHISQARRAAQSPTIHLAISDYDTVRMGLRLVDPQRRLQARDDLRRVCEYVAERKETSKAASVLILRFFHSYFPVEIARILRTTRQAVEIWLLNARRESRVYLENPAALKVISRKAVARKVAQLSERAGVTRSGDISRELCESIFASRHGRCLTREQLEQLYTGDETIECSRLAHIVSCPVCLEIVNDLLNLSSLGQRYQTDSTDSDVPPTDSGGPPASASGNGGTGEAGKRLRRRRRETIEHRPQELRIAVNGFFVSRQKVGLPVNELALKLNLEEKISFVEIFSEQGLLLSHFSVTPPTDGEIEQREEIEFGEGRALELGVNFETQWPTLHVIYRDPLVAQLEMVSDSSVGAALGGRPSSMPPESLPQREAATEGRPSSMPPESHPQREAATEGRPYSAWLERPSWLRPALFWRPATVTGLVALLIVAAVIVTRRHGPTAPFAAADILQRATQVEQAAAVSTQTVIHRTLQIEERAVRHTSSLSNGGELSGELLARRSVEVWHSATRGVTARRLYDDRGRLLAGEWTRADNVSTLYHHGSSPQLQIRNAQLAITSSRIWQIAPSAKDFVALMNSSGSPEGSLRHQSELTLEVGPNYYVLRFQKQGEIGSPSVVKASLTLSRDDLHAIEQTLLIDHPEQSAQQERFRFYRIVETSFERRPNDAVAPAVFDPEPQLLGEVDTVKKPDPEGFSPYARSSVTAPPVVATAALEVEVLQLLNQANAFMGEHLSVKRTAEGRLIISGLVDSEERQSELLRALATVRDNPAVRIEVETVAQAAQRERPKSSGNITIERVEATEGTSPAYKELKRKFSEDQARRFADGVMVRSRQARRHALALKQLAERFSLTDLQTLPEADRARWVGLLQGHARAFFNESQGLRRDLQQVFPEQSVPGAVASASMTDAEIQAAVRRLYELSVAFDQDVRQSFSVSAESSAVAQVTTQQFWQSLRSAELLAAQIQSAR
ncbi:MAG TPA: RNA polymerase sigma factor [Pyrinomonadaceae bacterium]|nr:RNA polymerase sigma factor [Pyrinomonadaceae bacterium]